MVHANQAGSEVLPMRVAWRPPRTRRAGNAGDPCRQYRNCGPYPSFARRL